MKFNDFNAIMHKVCNNVWFSADSKGKYMWLDPRGDQTKYPLNEVMLKAVNNKYTFVHYVMEYMMTKGEFDHLEGNFSFSKVDKVWDSYNFNAWYPSEYEVTDNGVDDGALNVYLNGNLIGEISAQDRNKEQPYKYIQPLKDAEACNEFVAKCHEVWLANQSNEVTI